MLVDVLAAPVFVCMSSCEEYTCPSCATSLGVVLCFITPFAILPWCYYQQRVTDGALPRAAQARSVPEPVARSIKLVHLSLCELAGRAEFERAHREIWAHLSICMLGAHTRPDKLVGGHQASSMHLPISRTDLYRPRTDLYRPGRNSMPPVRMLCSVTRQEVAVLDLRQ